MPRLNSIHGSACANGLTIRGGKSWYESTCIAKNVIDRPSEAGVIFKDASVHGTAFCGRNFPYAASRNITASPKRPSNSRRRPRLRREDGVISIISDSKADRRIAEELARKSLPAWGDIAGHERKPRRWESPALAGFRPRPNRAGWQRRPHSP